MSSRSSILWAAPRMPTGPRAARAYARAAAAGTVSVMSVFKFTNSYSMKSCNAGVVALVSRARDAYAVIECREHLQIM